MKLAITGALGHIGSQLLRELPQIIPNCQLILIDDLRTQRFASLFHLPEGYQYQFIQGDVTQMDLLGIFDDCDAVIHLAAITDAQGSVNNKEEVESVNYTGTQRVANACATTCTRLLHVSSTSVYGTQKTVVDENCSPADLQPQSPYAHTKLREEQYLADLKNKRSLRAVSCRFGTIFGSSPGMRFHTAVNKFCWQAILGEPLTVWKTAYDQMRPYLSLSDAIAAIAFFLERDLFNNTIYNVVTLNTTVREVINEIKKHIPDVHVDFVDSPIMNQLSYEVSAAKLAIKGFEPTGSLQKGIIETITKLNNTQSARLFGRNSKRTA